MRLLFAAALAFLVCSARSQTPYPTGTAFYPDNGLPGFTLASAVSSSWSQVPATGPGFAEAWALATKVNADNPWTVQALRPIPRSFSSGDVSFVRFYARATFTSHESGGATLTVYAQGGAPTYLKSLERELFVTTEWREYLLPFIWEASYAANEATLVFAGGYRAQTIEIGGFDAVTYGKTVSENTLPRSLDTYPGRETNAPWRAAALARIEQHRKGGFAVRVVDEAGQPVAGASVRVAQRKHAFEFGSALVMQRLLANDADSRLYRQKVLELFNAGSTENDLKAQPWQGDWGAAYAREQTLRGLQWMTDHGLSVRGHVLVWPSWSNSSQSINALRGTGQQNTIPAKLLAHIADVVPATRPWVTEWDVLNEPYTNHDFMDLFGEGIQVDWFNEARKHHPDARLFLNDYANDNLSRHLAHIEHFEKTANYLKGAGAPIGGLGLQAHMGGVPTPPDQFIATLDRYAATVGLPVRITEFDVNTRDEGMQADYTRDFLIAAFSHPSVVGVQFWGFWEEQHWLPAAALFRSDWSERPAVQAYRDLVLDTWRTRVQGTTDGSGVFASRGVFGEYVITVTQGAVAVEKVFNLRPGEPAPTVTVPLSVPRVVNLSTRASGRSGSETLIGGFVLGGEGTKDVLLRAVGPGLSGFGISGVMARPHARLHAGPQFLQERSKWDNHPDAVQLKQQMQASGAFALAEGSADTAFVAPLGPGSYTLQITGENNGQGVALFEAYDTSLAGSLRFVNLSTRAYVGAGEGVAIGGMVLKGVNSRRLLFRAVGPGLVPFNVQGVLARPYITVMAGSQVVAANAGWESSADVAELTRASAKAGAFALAPGSADSAVLATLDARDYTVVVRGADGGTGVCLIEIYDVGP